MAQAKNKNVTLIVEAKVLDEAALRKYAGERYEACWQNPLPDLDLSSIVLEALVISNENPSNDLYGIEVMDSFSSETIDDPMTVSFTVEIKVIDEKLLREYTDKRYQACWNAPLDEDMDLAQVVLEAVVISNENPDPEKLGLEVMSSEAHEIA
jgi:hypothetical protein